MATNNWYVITGGPSSGKTTTVNLLRGRGYKTTIEHARHLIDTERVSGKTAGEIRKNQIEFQHKVLDMQIAEERALPPREVTFLDRAIPDALAYYQFLGIAPDEKIKTALDHVSYKKVFILDLLPLAPDYARTEDIEARRRIHDLLTRVYESLPFPVIRVPVLPPQKRIDFILEHL